jgi:hypothetical protein
LEAQTDGSWGTALMAAAAAGKVRAALRDYSRNEVQWSVAWC